MQYTKFGLCQVAVERPAKLAVAMLSEKSDKQPLAPKVLMPLIARKIREIRIETCKSFSSSCLFRKNIARSRHLW